MDHLVFRPLTVADTRAVLDILLAAEAAEPSGTGVDLAELEDEFRQPGVDLRTGSLGVLDGDRMVAFGSLLAPGAGTHWDLYLSGGVLPAYRKQGIGTELLRRMSRLAVDRRAAARLDLPGMLKIGISAGRDSARAFAASAGFAVLRYFFVMRAELVPTESATVPDGVEIREWTAADDEPTRAAYNDAFADHWGSVPAGVERWRSMFAESPFFRPRYSRVAVAPSRYPPEVLGFVLVEEYDSDTELHGYRSGYISRVGTVRSARGRGLATLLLKHAMAALHDAGCRYAELDVDADSPTGAGRLYEALGFSTIRRNEIVGRDLDLVAADVRPDGLAPTAAPHRAH